MTTKTKTYTSNIGGWGDAIVRSGGEGFVILEVDGSKIIFYSEEFHKFRRMLKRFVKNELKRGRGEPE